MRFLGRGRTEPLAREDAPVGGYTVEVRDEMLGLVLELDSSDRAVVYQVITPGPLEGQVESGDILTHINGKSLAGYGIREVADLCSRMRHKKKTLTFLYSLS